MEIEAGTLLTLVTSFVGSLVVWWGLAFKFKGFYQEFVMSFIFYTLLCVGGATSIVFLTLINFADKIQRKFENDTNVLTFISDSMKSYTNVLAFIGLVTTLYFFAWILLTIFMLKYESYERRNRGNRV